MTSDQRCPMYVIRVRGVVDPVWATRLTGFTISHDSVGNTRFCGPVVDQAALYGVISRVRDLGLTLMSVEVVESGADDGGRVTEIE